MELRRKVCMLGDFAVGKTSLVRRFVYDTFDDEYIATIGVKVTAKELVVPRGGEHIALGMLIWDLAGGERFEGVRASYLRGTSGALLVCDGARADTFESLVRYAEDIRAVDERAVLVIVVNKSDLAPAVGLLDRVEALAADLDAAVCPTSALTGEGVETAFRRLGHGLLLRGAT